MSRNAFSFAAACILVAAIHAQVHSYDGQHVSDMDERTLQEKYHIPLTKDGFLAALHHPLPEVRTFAADELAARGEKDAIPAILAAMAIEPVPGGQVELALAAARLGSDDGVSALKSRCQNRNWPPGLRMTAAGAMLNLGRNDCLGDVLDVLRSAEASQSAEENQAVQQALSLIPRFKSVTPDELREFRSIVPVFLLRSSFPWVRATACFTVRLMGGSWAVEQLRNALAVEPEEYVRGEIKTALSAIGSQ